MACSRVEPVAVTPKTRPPAVRISPFSALVPAWKTVAPSASDSARPEMGWQYQTAGGSVLPLYVNLIQGAVHAGLENVHQVGVQHGQDGLSLRVAEAGVVLHHPGAVLG